jgi:hypothetical protein
MYISRKSVQVIRAANGQAATLYLRISDVTVKSLQSSYTGLYPQKLGLYLHKLTFKPYTAQP